MKRLFFLFVMAFYGCGAGLSAHPYHVHAGGPESVIYYYYGEHPVNGLYGDGFCFEESYHTHNYQPEYVDFYVFQEGYYYYIGDPWFFAYPYHLYWFYDPHPVVINLIVHWCYIDGPHTHAFAPEPVKFFVFSDGAYMYYGQHLWNYKPEKKIYLYKFWPERYAVYKKKYPEKFEPQKKKSDEPQPKGAGNNEPSQKIISLPTDYQPKSHDKAVFRPYQKEVQNPLPGGNKGGQDNGQKKGGDAIIHYFGGGSGPKKSFDKTQHQQKGTNYVPGVNPFNTGKKENPPPIYKYNPPASHNNGAFKAPHKIPEVKPIVKPEKQEDKTKVPQIQPQQKFKPVQQNNYNIVHPKPTVIKDPPPDKYNDNPLKRKK